MFDIGVVFRWLVGVAVGVGFVLKLEMMVFICGLACQRWC